MQGRGGKMERKILFTAETIHEGTAFYLEYELLCSLAREGDVYGVAIRKKTADGQLEEEQAEGLTHSRAVAEIFLKKLADGLAFPITLPALCDDFLYEEERRLFYVALTRTKNEVFLLVDKSNPSIFVKELLKEHKKYIEIL